MAQTIKKIKVGDETHPIDGAFYLGTLSTVAGSGSSGSYKSVRWYVSDCEGVTAPYDGMRIAIKIPLAGVSTAGAMLSINGNNDADYHPLAYNVNTVLTSHFPVNSIKVFVYDANQTMTCYKTANTAVSVTGVWKADSNYDSNTVITYGTMEYYFRPYNGANPLYRYKFVALDKDNRVVPLTTTNVANGTAVTNITPTNVAFRPDKIWWYATTTTIAASAVTGAQTLWRSGYNANNATNGGMAICNFNETVSAYRLIYLCGTYNKTTGLFTLRDGGTASSKNYYKLVPTNTASITLSSYFTSGYDYILLGGTYSSNNYIQLFDNNPMFHFDGTNLVPYDTWNTAQNAPVNADWNATTGLSSILNKPTSLKNPNSLDIYGNTTSVISYDGSGKKSLYFKSSTSLGYFTVGDGTTSQAVYVGYSNTDTHYTSTWSVYAGTTLISTFNQSANRSITFSAGDNITLTGTANSGIITISATAPAATGYAGTLSVSANSYTSGTQTLQSLYGENGHLDIGSPVINIGVSEYGGMINTMYTDVSINAGVVFSDRSNLAGSVYITANGYWYGDHGDIYLNASDGMVYVNAYSGLSVTYGLYTDYAYASNVYASNAYISSAYISKLSVLSAGNQYIKGSTISIYASQGANPAILLSAGTTGAAISLYASSSLYLTTGNTGMVSLTGGSININATTYTTGSINLTASYSMSITAGSNIYISAGSVLSAGKLYMSGSFVYLSANGSSGVLNLSAASSIVLNCHSGTGNYAFVHRVDVQTCPIVAAVEHCVKYYCSGRWNVRFSFLDYTSAAAFNKSLASYVAATYPNPLIKLASCLYDNGYRSEYTALPVAAQTTTSGLTTNGIPIGIFATSAMSTSIYFVFGYGNTTSASSANAVVSTAGNSSYVILYDNRRVLQ